MENLLDSRVFRGMVWSMSLQEVPVEEVEATKSPTILYFDAAETELRGVYRTIASIVSILHSKLHHGVLFNVGMLSDGDGQGFPVISIQGDYAQEVERLFPGIQVTHFTQDGYDFQKHWSDQLNY